MSKQLLRMTIAFSLYSIFLGLPEKAYGTTKWYQTDLQAAAKYFDQTSYQTIDSESFELPAASLPASRSQSIANSCLDHCFTGMIQYRLCQDRGRASDCAVVNDNGKDLVSTQYLRMLLSQHPDTGRPRTEQFFPKAFSDEPPENHKFLENFNFHEPKVLYSESCFPFDLFDQSETINSDAAKLAKFYDELRSKFLAVRTEIMGSGRKLTAADFQNNCKSCDYVREQIAKAFPVTPDIATITLALNTHTFDQFLGEVKISKKMRSDARHGVHQTCKQIGFERRLSVSRFPGTLERITPAIILARAKVELKERTAPIMVNSICIARSQDANKCGEHCMLITGYRRVRNVNSPYDEKTLLRFLNSWGERWQRQHNGGWVDQDKLEANLVTYSISRDGILQPGMYYNKQFFGSYLRQNANLNLPPKLLTM